MIVILGENPHPEAGSSRERQSVEPIIPHYPLVPADQDEMLFKIFSWVVIARGSL